LSKAEPYIGCSALEEEGEEEEEEGGGGGGGGGEGEEGGGGGGEEEEEEEDMPQLVTKKDELRETCKTYGVNGTFVESGINLSRELTTSKTWT